MSLARKSSLRFLPHAHAYVSDGVGPSLRDVCNVLLLRRRGGDGRIFRMDKLETLLLHA